MPRIKKRSRESWNPVVKETKPYFTLKDLERIKRRIHQGRYDRLNNETVLKSVIDDLNFFTGTYFSLLKYFEAPTIGEIKAGLEDLIEKVKRLYESMDQIDLRTKYLILEGIPNADEFFNQTRMNLTRLGRCAEKKLNDLPMGDPGRIGDKALSYYLTQLSRIFRKVTGMANLKDRNFRTAFIDFVYLCLEHIGKAKSREAIKQLVHRYKRSKKSS